MLKIPSVMPLILLFNLQTIASYSLSSASWSTIVDDLFVITMGHCIL